MSSPKTDEHEIQPDELSRVTGGVDYSYWHPNGFRVAFGNNADAAHAYLAANPGGKLMQQTGDGVVSPVPIKPPLP